MWVLFIFYTSFSTYFLSNTVLGNEVCPNFSPDPLRLGNLQFGIHMKTSCFRSFYGISITECATECLLRKSRCKSVNYWRISLKCQLCQNMTGGDNMGPSNGGVHSDISTWSQSFASSCSEKNCGYLERCMPNRAAGPSNKHVCDISECPLPEVKPGTAIDQETGVGVTLRYTCINQRLKYTGNPFITCQSGGNWTGSDFACDPYELVFQITPGVGGDVYEAWMHGGNYTTNSDKSCQTLGKNPSCKFHFRSSILDRWSVEVKSMVKVGIYKDGREVHNITFKAVGSNLESWFSRPNVLSTTYTGILHTNTFIFFSIQGYDTMRRFYINLNFDGCPKDIAWMMVIVESKPNGCQYDKQPDLPAIIYVTNPEGGLIDKDLYSKPTLGQHLY
ncbi:hypothetical protein ACJMK2_021375 [Sinanodonta woodiana]|uniref:Sushi domain-containing protein n=1 Tax=Sinanodonta woodiana TaxID=1069815 RepID=A0ABD3TFW7_SINWO